MAVNIGQTVCVVICPSSDHTVMYGVGVPEVMVKNAGGLSSEPVKVLRSVDSIAGIEEKVDQSVDADVGSSVTKEG